jgi:uncharacterized membrane protein
MKRILSLDLARGFTVLLIAPIHTMLVFSRISERNTLLAQFLGFVAEWHGAQILMLIMGISFSLSEPFSKNQNGLSVLKKAIGLSVFAYALNLFKFVIPHFFGWLPETMLTDLQVDPGIHGYTQLFLLGDILHFAALALIILFIISKCNSSQNLLLYLAIIICLLAPIFWDASSDNAIINYGLQLLGGQPPRVFFPLLPWLAYLLLGYCIGQIIQKEKQCLGFDSFWIVGIGLILISFILKYFLHDSGFSSFYRTTPLDTLIHIGYVLTMLSIWHWISRNVKPNYLFRLFTYCSRRITQIYIIQWILICWMIPLIGYQQTGFLCSVFLIFTTSLITLSFSLLIDLAKSQK